MAGRLVRVLEQVAGDPGVRVGQVQLLDAAEREQLVAGWNDTAAAVPEDTIAGLFEAQAARDPGAVAVVCGPARLTYAQLDAAAGRVAGWLAARGVGPEQVVGLVLPRSAEMIIMLLGVLKAGAAYLPIDPGYPPARIGYMLADARPALVACTTGTAAALPGPAVVPRLVIDDPATAAALAAAPPAPAAGLLLARCPAYVIYTSGSTGTPKGVAVTHAGLVNYLLYSAQCYRSAARLPGCIPRLICLDLDRSVRTSLIWPLAAGAGRWLLESPDLGIQTRCISLTRSAHLVTTIHFVPCVAGFRPGAGGMPVLGLGGCSADGEVLANGRAFPERFHAL